MDVNDPVTAHFDAHLTNRLKERQRLDVTDGAADFNKTDIGIAGALLDTLLDFVGNVRNDLDSGTEVVAAALLADDAFVNAPGRKVAVAPAGGRPHKALVVAEIEVGLGTVMRDKYLTVLKRAHRARIHVEVGIQLDHADRKSAGLENGAKTGRSDALAKRGDHAAGYENIRCHIIAYDRRKQQRAGPKAPQSLRVLFSNPWKYSPSLDKRRF